MTDQPTPYGQQSARAPSWLPVGTGTPVDDVPDTTEAWLDLWPAPTESPSGAPPRRRTLRALLPTLAIVLVTAMLIGAAARSYRDELPLDRTYLPVDGSYAQVTLDGVAGVMEQGVTYGGAVTDLGYLGNEALAGRTSERSRAWISSHDVWIADARTGTGSGTRHVRAVFTLGEEGLRLVGATVPGDAITFRPSLPVEPTAERSLSTRTLSRQGAQAQATATFAGSTSGSCLEWHVTAALFTAQRTSIDLAVHLCPTTGLTSLTFTRAGEQPVRLAVTGHDPPTGRFDGSLTTPTIDPEGAAQWTARKIEPSLTDAIGTAPYFTSAVLPPAATSGLVLLAGNDGSVTAVAAHEGAGGAKAGAVVWAAHPGGTVVRLLTAGNLILAATSQRRIIAYDTHGRRVWQRDLNDLVADWARVGRRLYCLAANGGVVALDLRDGHRLWHTAIDSAQPAPALAASSSRVAVVASGGDVNILRARDGEWLTHAAGSSVTGIALVGTQIVAQRSQQLMRQQTEAAGTLYSIATAVGSSPSMVTAGGLVVSSGDSGVACFDLRTGALLARSAPAAEMAAGAGAVAVARDGRVTVLTRSRPQGTTIDLPGRPSINSLAVTAQGVVGYDGTNLYVLS